jgi:hypothetical protein
MSVLLFQLLEEQQPHEQLPREPLPREQQGQPHKQPQQQQLPAPETQPQQDQPHQQPKAQPPSTAQSRDGGAPAAEPAASASRLSAVAPPPPALAFELAIAAAGSRADSIVLQLLSRQWLPGARAGEAESSETALATLADPQMLSGGLTTAAEAEEEQQHAPEYVLEWGELLHAAVRGRSIALASALARAAPRAALLERSQSGATPLGAAVELGAYAMHGALSALTSARLGVRLAFVYCTRAAQLGGRGERQPASRAVRSPAEHARAAVELLERRWPGLKIAASPTSQVAGACVRRVGIARGSVGITAMARTERETGVRVSWSEAAPSRASLRWLRTSRACSHCGMA